MQRSAVATRVGAHPGIPGCPRAGRFLGAPAPAGPDGRALRLGHRRRRGFRLARPASWPATDSDHTGPWVAMLNQLVDLAPSTFLCWTEKYTRRKSRQTKNEVSVYFMHGMPCCEESRFRSDLPRGEPRPRPQGPAFGPGYPAPRLGPRRQRPRLQAGAARRDRPALPPNGMLG